MIIIPSTPRLSTPARSATSSPAAAKSSAVEAVSTARMMASASCMIRLAMRPHQANAVEDEGIGREHKEQQDALEDLGQVERDPHGNLGLLASDEGERQEQASKQYADRMQASQECDDDRREAVSGRDIWPQISNGASNLDNAGEAGECSCHQEGQDHELVGVESGKPLGPGGGADDLDFKPLDGASEQEHGRDHDDKSDERAGMEPAALDQNRNRRDRVEGRGGREIVSLWVAPGTANEIIQKQIGDVDQHQAGENFARAELRLADRRDEGIERAAQSAEHEHRRQHPLPGVGTIRLDREPTARDSANQELPLGSDVPDIGEVAERQAERDA